MDKKNRRGFHGKAAQMCAEGGHTAEKERTRSKEEIEGRRRRGSDFQLFFVGLVLDASQRLAATAALTHVAFFYCYLFFFIFSFAQRKVRQHHRALSRATCRGRFWATQWALHSRRECRLGAAFLAFSGPAGRKRGFEMNAHTTDQEQRQEPPKQHTRIPHRRTEKTAPATSGHPPEAPPQQASLRG